MTFVVRFFNDAGIVIREKDIKNHDTTISGYEFLLEDLQRYAKEWDCKENKNSIFSSSCLRPSTLMS